MAGNVIRSYQTGDTIIRQTVVSNERGPQGKDGKSLKIMDVGTMDGKKKFFVLPEIVNPQDVSFALLNGVIYTSDYSIDPGGATITLNFDNDKLPKGSLQIGVLK